MASDLETLPTATDRATLPDDFVDRLTLSLENADRDRRRHQWFHRARRALPLCLLVGPVLAWRLMLASPGGVHVYVDALAWLAFFLDVGVHADTAVLSYLGLQALPSLVGFLLFALLTATLLWEQEPRER